MTETLLTAILALIINGLIIIGVHRSTRDGMIFGFVERWWVRENPDDPAKPLAYHLQQSERIKIEMAHFDYGNRINGLEKDAEFHEKKIRELEQLEPAPFIVPTISYPLTECPVCMPSVWGALGFAGFYLPFIPIGYAWTAVPYILALCGLMWISRSLWMEVEE